MAQRSVWKLVRTDKRENMVRKFEELLNTTNFSAIMDIVFLLASERLRQKDSLRREVQRRIKEFGFIPEDFVWK